MRRLDDALVAAALAGAAALCLWFRYLPMVDLPQHYAMASIIAHHGDPAYGFADRYVFDFLGRPYATVYLLGAGLSRVLPLGAAMRIVVALCTVAPLVGAWTLLRATERPRLAVLLAVPVVFGSVWHWGFLNFLLGTGLLLAGLALVVATGRRPTWRRAVLLGLLALALLFTHVHGLVMLLALAPLYAWAFRPDGTTAAGALRPLVALAPAALGAAAFVAFTWARAPAPWDTMDPGLRARILLFPDHLGAGLPAPWPLASLAAMAAVAATLLVLAERGPAPPHARRHLAVFALGAASQLVLFFALPLSTGTAAYVSARHALLFVLFALPLLPRLTGRRQLAARALLVPLAAAALVLVGLHLGRFDREARAFDPILARMAPNRRVAALVFASRSPAVHPRVHAYLHFDGYYQAAKGGDLGHSFAQAFNVPIRYRPGLRHHALDERVEFDPARFSFARDLPHFDYLLLRRPGPPALPPGIDLELVAASGPWSLWANPAAVTP